jgi:hypothetical protein
MELEQNTRKRKTRQGIKENLIWSMGSLRQKALDLKQITKIPTPKKYER